MREKLTKVEAPLSANSTICALMTKEGTLNLSICKGETIKSGTHIRQRKVRVLLTEEEIRSITHLVFYIEHLFSGENKMSDYQRKVSPPKLLLILKDPTGREVDKDDKMLPEELQVLVNRDKVKKIVCYEKTARLPACFMVHMNECSSDYSCYEMLYVKHLKSTIHFCFIHIWFCDGTSNSWSSCQWTSFRKRK